MGTGYTAFITYTLGTDSGATSYYGYSNAIHCNYIKSLQLSTISNKEINLYFDNADDFKFLSVNGSSGYSANRIYMLLQIVNNTEYNNLNDVHPDPGSWKIIDITNQITSSGFTIGNLISPANITNVIFKVTISQYNLAPYYTLEYLNYPHSISGNTNTTNSALCFGDETYFMGNVSASIQAVAYSTDLAITLPLNQFNSTNNETWDGISSILISEIGLYDENKNLVGIAKLNSPITKDSTISRTIVFGLDF